MITINRAYYHRWWFSNAWNDYGWIKVQPWFFIITIQKRKQV